MSGKETFQLHDYIFKNRQQSHQGQQNIRKPLVIGDFSLDEERKIMFNDSNMKLMLPKYIPKTENGMEVS